MNMTVVHLNSDCVFVVLSLCEHTTKWCFFLSPMFSWRTN